MAAGIWGRRGEHGVVRLRLHKFLKARLLTLVAAITDHAERQVPALLAAMSFARSACARMILAELTSSAWSISGGV